MLSAHRINREFQTGRYEALLQALTLHLGLELPLSLRIRLSAHPTAAVALSLRRLVELTYGSTPLSREMTTQLLAQQSPDGSFHQDPLPTACVGAALGRVLSEHTGQAHPQAAAAREQALLALASLQEEDGLFHHSDDRTVQDRAATAAFILFILAPDSAFRQIVRYADLMDWFEQHQDEIEPGAARLWELARQDQPAGPSPLLNAVAA